MGGGGAHRCAPSYLRHMKFPSAAFLFAATLLTGLRAQETWAPVVSPTTQNLWSVASNGALFVAVGDGGTILTSPEGATWSARASGTTTWLVGAAYANNQFVVVGANGTLLTSADGLAWTVRASGIQARLNAVAFGNGRWLAVGENGSAVTSTDGVNWTIVPRSEFGWTSALRGWARGLCFAYGQFVFTGESGHIVTTADANYFADRSMPTAANLEGVTYARRRFVAVGDGGLVLTSPDASIWRGSITPAAMRAITFFNNTFVAAAADGSILTSPDAAHWTPRQTGNATMLTALAGNGTALVAVGLGGTVLRSAAAQAAPAIVTPPADITEAAGNHVLLTVTATGTAPLTYQWTFNGQPIVGATNETLTLRSVSSILAGRYAVTVRNALGSTTSAAATLTVVDRFPGPADLIDHTFVPGSVGTPTVFQLQTDGKILCAASGTLSRLLPTGAIDPTFTGPAIAGLTVNTLALQPDGKIVVGGYAGNATTGSTTPYLARLGVNGVADATFAAPTALPGNTIVQVVVQPDGKILLADNTPRVTRLNANGSIDSGFVRPELSHLTGNASVTLGVQAITLAPDGKIVVALALPSPFTGALPQVLTDTTLVRLLADGTLDPTFAPYHASSNYVQFLQALPDGHTLLGTQDVGYFGSGHWTLNRLNSDGTNDPTFQTRTGSIPKYGGEARFGVDDTARIVVAVSYNNTSSPRFSLLRFLPDGTLDLTLRGGETFGSPFTRLNAIAVQPDGRTLVSQGGNFRRLVASNAMPINPPVVLDDSTPPISTAAGGGSATFTTAVAGTGPFTYSWSGFNADRTTQIISASPSAGALTIVNTRLDGAFHVTVSNAAGSLTCPPQLLHVIPSAPAIASVPATVEVEAGRIAQIPFTAMGSGPLKYQWFFNGKEIGSGELRPASATDPSLPQFQPGTLQLDAATPQTAGTYRLVLTNDLGSQAADVIVALVPASRLIDVATRGFVGTGDSALIAGFVVTGSTPKWVLIRGVGPRLAPFGITDFLLDPKLTLFDATGAQLEENDNWIGSEESYTNANWPATFGLAPGSRDAIISRQLAPGNYTARLSGVGNTTGVALIEVYEGIHEMPRLTNLSSRVFIGTGSQTAISGVVVKGDLPKKLLLRVAGPALRQFGVTGTLADPSLTLFDSSGTAVVSNNDWTASGNQAELGIAVLTAGAFPFEVGSKDAAVLVTVSPGSYTVVVGGASGTTGVALVEVYEVP